MAVWGTTVGGSGRLLVNVDAGVTICITHVARAATGATAQPSVGTAGVCSIEINRESFVLGQVENALSVNVPMTQTFTLVNGASFPISVLGTRTGGPSRSPSSIDLAPGEPPPPSRGSARAPSQPQPFPTQTPPAPLSLASPPAPATPPAAPAGDDAVRQMADAVRTMVDAAWEASAKEVVQLKCQAVRHAEADDRAYRAALSQAQRAGRFEDAAFPAGRASLCFDWGAKQGDAKASEDVGDVWERAVWRRPAQFLALGPGEKPTLFDAVGQKVEPDDIEQGELGDCYLLSSLSVLAEQEDRVEALIDPERTRVDLGLFVARFCVGGHWRQVLVDDAFPCYAADAGGGGDDGLKGPIFSHSKGSGLWVLVLEKAWAKVFGSFQSIIWGVPGESLTNLTGAPCKFVPADKADPQRTWAQIHRAVASADGAGGASSQGWFAVALMPDDPEHDLQKEVGLVEGHAYGVLDTAVINGTPLIKLRNPWGSCEWKGDWSDGDTRSWTPEAKAQLSQAARDDLGIDDGSFWMDAADFSKYFAGAQICRASRGWRHTSETVKLRGGRASAVTLTGPGTVSADISVHQQDRRFFFKDERYNHADFRYLGVRLMVLRADTGEIVGEWPLTAERDVWAEAKALTEGKYWVLIESDWDGSPHLLSHTDKGQEAVEVGVSCFHSQPTPKTVVELLTPAHCRVDGELLKRFALRRACEAAQSVDYGRFFDDAPGAEKITKKHYADPSQADTFAWLYENRSADLRLTETVTFTVVNMALEGEPAPAPAPPKPPPPPDSAAAASAAAGVDLERELTVTVDLPPGGSRLVVLEQVAAGRMFSWSSKSHVELVEL